jgi:hypothetical protein
MAKTHVHGHHRFLLHNHGLSSDPHHDVGNKCAPGQLI